MLFVRSSPREYQNKTSNLWARKVSLFLFLFKIRRTKQKKKGTYSRTRRKEQNRPRERDRHVSQYPLGADTRAGGDVQLISHQHCHAHGDAGAGGLAGARAGE